MTIDIVDLTDPEYSDLNAVQVAMVREAQQKKNEILERAEQQKEEYLSMLIAGDMARNTFGAHRRGGAGGDRRRERRSRLSARI